MHMILRAGMCGKTFRSSGETISLVDIEGLSISPSARTLNRAIQVTALGCLYG